jgi:hypothetical protein
MSETNLLEIARQRRVAALASLKKREDNLFSLAEYRMRTRTHRPLAVFRTVRRRDDNVFASVAPDDRMAA